MNIDYLHHDTKTDEPLQTQIETLTRWQDPTIEEYKKEITRLNNIIEQVIEYIEYSLNNSSSDERMILQMVLAKLKVELKEGKECHQMK